MVTYEQAREAMLCDLQIVTRDGLIYRRIVELRERYDRASHKWSLALVLQDVHRSDSFTVVDANMVTTVPV